MTSIGYENHLPRLSKQVRKSAAAVVQKTAFDIEAAVKQSMQPPKSGRVYQRGKRQHQASAPGESPAIDYGNLVNSIQTLVSTSGLTAMVYTDADYAVPLEFGSRRAKARPFMRNAAIAAIEKYHDAMQQVLEQMK